MSNPNEGDELRLAVEIEAGMRKRIEAGDWSRLSHPPFARDWDSDADAVDDDLAAFDRGLREARDLM